jgi:hypothetical protein
MPIYRGREWFWVNNKARFEIEAGFVMTKEYGQEHQKNLNATYYFLI